MPFTSKDFARVWLKPLTFWLLALPGLWIGGQWVAYWLAWPNDLGFNPAQYTHHFLGETAIRVLLVALAVTPFRDWTGWAPIMRVRRRIGLFAFAYALMHVAVYLALDLELSLAKLWEDVLERTYITFGMAALALLIPLAITSHDALIKALGAVRWRRLHWAVYPIGVLAVVHHFFAEKGDQPGPWVHAAILAVLLGWRVAKRLKLVKPRTPARRRPAQAGGVSRGAAAADGGGGAGA
jgi:sulfoxide reductase heme-binding subunit YedZ